MEHTEFGHISEADVEPIQNNDLQDTGFKTLPTNGVCSVAEIFQESLEDIKKVNRSVNKLTSNIVKKIFEPNHCDLYLKEETHYVVEGKVIEQSADTIIKNEYSDEVNEDMRKSKDKTIKVNTNSYLDSTGDMNVEYDVEFINNDMETDDEFLNNDNDEFLHDRNSDIDSDVVYIDDSNNRMSDYNVVLSKDNDDDRNNENDSDIEFICKVNSNNRTRNDSSAVDLSLDSDASNNDEANKDESTGVEKPRKMMPVKVKVNKYNDNKIKPILTGDINFFTTNTAEFNSTKVLALELLDNENAEILSDDNSYKGPKIDNSINMDSFKGDIRNNANKDNTKVAKKRSKIVPKSVKSKIIKTKPAYVDDLKLFKITELSYEEQLLEFKERKESSRYKLSLYKCAICYKVCNTKNAYERHVLKHTSDFGDYECSICKLRYRRRNYLTAHVRDVHSNKYNCTSCIFVTKHKRLARLHEKWHKGITYTCPHCKIKFNKVSSYFSHLRTKHRPDVVCTICGSTFTGEKGLHQHMTSIHRLINKEPAPTCKPCGITSSKAAFKQHVKVTSKHRKNEFSSEKLSQPSWCKPLEMKDQVQDEMVCIICLDTDSKLYKLRKYNLEKAYSNLIGFKLSKEFKLKTICIECAQRLRNFNIFREKSLRAHTLLMELFKKNEFLTVQNIKTINRKNNNLISTISKKNFEADHCDLHLTEISENEEKKYIEINTDDIMHNEVKDESKDVEYQIKLEKSDENNPDNGKDGIELNTKFNSEVEVIDNERFSEVEFLNEDAIDSNSDEVEPKVKSFKPTNKGKIKSAPKPVKLFKVAFLNYEEQLADVIKRKESSNYQDSLYKCTKCYKGFNNKNAYNDHLLRHTNKFGDFECALCGLHYKLRKCLSHHIRRNHSCRYTCMTCPFVTKHKRSAYLHERWHKGTEYKCSHCDKQFIRVSTYMNHLRIKHPSEFSCPICGYSFVGQKGLDQHMNLKHRFEDVASASGPVCELCNIRFATDDAYNLHMKVSPKHSSDGIRKRNDPSVYCQPRYKRIRQRTEDDSVTCEQCGIELKDYRSYNQHFKQAHPDKNRTKYAPTSGHCLCEQCGKVFKSQALLRYHMPVHTGQKTFKCDVCDKGFMLRSYLLIHKKIHSDTRETYECRVCGKSFAYQANRARHMALHNAQKAFKCEFCEKIFATAAVRGSHVAHVHLKKPWPKRNRGPRVARLVRRRRDTATAEDE